MRTHCAHQVTFQPEHSGCDRGGTCMVALDAAEGNDAVCALCKGVSHEELELSDLVATQLGARAAVLLDKQLAGKATDIPLVHGGR